MAFDLRFPFRPDILARPFVRGQFFHAFPYLKGVNEFLEKRDIREDKQYGADEGERPE
jgi:hypothetical protein